MKSTPVAALLTAAFAATALAEPLTGLFTFEVSADGGATWSSSITINPGDPYLIRARALWTTVPDTLDVGFAGAQFEQIDLIGADASDVFGGASGASGVPIYLARQQGISQEWALHPGTGASASGLKIDDHAPSQPVSLGQLPVMTPHWINPDFHDENPIMLLLMDGAAGTAKTLTFSATWARRWSTPPSNDFRVYTTELGTSRKPLVEAVLSPAHIWIRPNASCIPDFNGDFIVDFADYLDFLTFYDTQDFRADLNHDGVIDFADYLDFLTAFDAGC